MRQIDPRMLQPGVRLKAGLFTRQGVKLLSPGVTLTREVCEAIAKSKWGALFLASSAKELLENNVLHEVRQAPLGEESPADMVTTGGVLAVEAGEVVEAHHAEAYALGAFQGPATREDRRHRALRMKIADQHVAELVDQWDRLARKIEEDPLADRPLEESGGLGGGGGGNVGGWPNSDQVVEMRSERMRKFRKVFARILSGVRTDVGELLEFVDEMVRLRSRCPERYPQLALLARPDRDLLPEHCYATASLVVGLAARLKWSVDHVRLAGLAGLVSDIGMGLVPQELRSSGRALSEVEVNRVRRHPAFSVLLLETVEGLPEDVRLAAYQHHERENASGYPSGAKSKAISDLARVVAVADTFVAATATRRFRPARRPYEALEETIMLASNRVLERRFVRALVETVGLFPIGGFVQLSNGSPALVVGARPDPIDRPIVMVGSRDIAAKGGVGGVQKLVVDLADFKPWELHVIQAIDAPMGTGLEPMGSVAG